MHISEGVLSIPVLVTGAALTGIGTVIGLKKLDYDYIAQAGMFSALFFLASLVRLPVGPSSVHLILSGIIGLILGWSAFPVVLVALILQAVFFQFGGITTLGVNTFNIVFPALICHYLFRRWIISKSPRIGIIAFFSGFLAVAGSSVMIAGSLLFTEKSFLETSSVIIISHAPLMVIEGVITSFCVLFLSRVQPHLLRYTSSRGVA